jgi:hypothetical protein
MAEVYTAARARLMIDGKKAGYATQVTVREMINREAIRVFDNIEVKEHAPVTYDVSLSMGFVRIVGASLKAQGVFPKTGGSPEEHLRNILNQGTITVALEDNRTGKITHQVEGVQFSEQDVSISAGGVAGVNVSAVALRVRDEGEI